MVESGWRLGGRYTLLDQLGTGVSGTVWRGLEDQTGTECAVKVLWPELVRDEAALAELNATLAWIGQLAHPGIVTVDDAVSEDAPADGDSPVERVVALISRLVPGESLRTLLDRQGSMSAPAALLMAAQLCDALKAARRVGLVHGDVKPSNLLLEPDPDGGFILRLTDFGMAPLLSRAATRSAEHAAAAAYVAPELGAGEPPSDASDVYAVGVVLFESLAGRPPEKAGELPPDLPQIVSASLASCLDKNPRQRPALADLRNVLREAATAIESEPASSSTGTVGTPAVPIPQSAPALAGPAATQSAASAVSGTVHPTTPSPASRAATAAAQRDRRRSRRRGDQVWMIGGAVAGGVAAAAIITFGHGSPDNGAGVTPVVAGTTHTGSGAASPSAFRSPSPTPSGSAHPSGSASAKSPRPSTSRGPAISPSASATASSVSPSPSPSPTVAPVGYTGHLYSLGSGTCLDTSGSYFADGVVEEIWTCNSSVGQVFTLTPSGELTVDHGAYCLDDAASANGYGTGAKLWTCGGQPYQQWNFNSNGTITGVQSGLCLDVTGARTANGTPVELWQCNGGSNQRWSLS